MSEDFVELLRDVGILFGFILSMFCYYSWLPLGIGMLICIIYTKSHDCYLNRATKNSVMEYEKLKEDETVIEKDIQECEAIDIMADATGAAEARVKGDREDGQPSVTEDEKQPTNGLNNCAILIECETVEKQNGGGQNGHGEQNVQPKDKGEGEVQETKTVEFANEKLLASVEEEHKGDRLNDVSEEESKKDDEVAKGENEATAIDGDSEVNIEDLEAAIKEQIKEEQNESQTIAMWFRARVIYVLPITLATFNISTVAFTPAHVFSSLLGESLDTLIAVSLAFSMSGTIRDVAIFLREEGKHALLFAVFYLVVNSYLVFYIYSNTIFLEFAAWSAFYLLLAAFRACCERSCKKKNNGSNGIPFSLGI